MTVVPNEATNIDGGTKAAVQQESGRVGQLSTEAAAEVKKNKRACGFR